MPPPPPIQLKTASPEETLTLGERLGQAAQPGDCIALIGDLGAGKTLLTKGIARGLGISPADITSPTFVLMARYAGKLTLYHFDAYRLSEPAELLAVGAEEVFYGNGLSVIEWADRVVEILPGDRLDISLTVIGASDRAFSLLSTGPRSLRLARAAAPENLFSPRAPQTDTMKILGIDHGEKRIGLAVSDALGIAAHGLPTLENRSIPETLNALRALIAERQITQLVVGLPLNMDGSEGPQALAARAFAEALAPLSLPVHFIDERLTSDRARRILSESGLSRAKQRQRVDRMAAQFILQAFLDSRPAKPQ